LTDNQYKEGGRKGWPIIHSALKSLLETSRPLPGVHVSRDVSELNSTRWQTHLTMEGIRSTKSAK
jgi:hypothetical protein